MKRILMMLALAAFLVAALSVSALSAFAAPITCSGNQTVTKTSSGWDCINNGGNPTGSERTKNSNDRK